METSAGSGSQESNWSEVSVSNQRSVGKKARRKVSSRFRMPKIAKVGKLAKVTKGPAKKIGKEK